MTQIFVNGLIALDCILHVDNIPSSADKYKASAGSIISGGPAANAAITIALLGGKVLLGGRLGNDATADLVINDLQRYNIDLSFIKQSIGGTTSFSSVFIDGNGERQIVNYRGNNLAEDASWMDNLTKVDAILTDNRWLLGTKKAIAIAQKYDIPIVVDGENSHSLDDLKMATHIAFSKQGLLALTSEHDIMRGLQLANEALPGWVCVTDGENGVYVANRETIDVIPAFKVTAIDTLGAGDVWHGAFTLRLGEGAPEEDAVVFANAAAALKCTTFGGRSPDKLQIEQFLKDNK